MNLCTSCGEDFGSVSAFDKHRIGKYPQTGPAEYSERLEQGLISPEEDWRSEPRFGRRCRTTEEMHALGMRKDARGRWRLPIRGTPSWTSDVKAVTAREDEADPNSHPSEKRGRNSDTSLPRLT